MSRLQFLTVNENKLTGEAPLLLNMSWQKDECIPRYGLMVLLPVSWGCRHASSKLVQHDGPEKY